MGRPTNRAERRREILDAFRQVVAKSGYERATIAVVAERYAARGTGTGPAAVERVTGSAATR